MHSMQCGFHTKRQVGHFSKEEISRFHIWNFESHKSLGRKVFLNPLRQHNLLEFSHFCLYWCCSFRRNLKYAFARSIWEVIKLYNLGDKSFEKDFSDDGFFQRKQIQIDMLYWPRPHHYWGGHAETKKSWNFWLLIPFLLGYAKVH